MGAVELCAVTPDPLDLADHIRAVSTPASGAVASFLGIVRDHDDDRAVTSLEYQGHPSAGVVLRRLADSAAARAGVDAVAVSHRVDATLGIGAAAIAVAVSAAHRAQALDACAKLVEDVKRELPVWKRQVFADGTDSWVNCP